MTKLPKAFTLVLAIAFMMVGCSQRRVYRVNDDRPIDLSGYWNDTDSRLVAEKMIQQAMQYSSWIDDFVAENGRKPVVMFDGVRNYTAEHIASQTFLNSFQRAVGNSQRITLVANALEREDLRRERADQQVNASPETRNAQFMERGADFLLQGEISYIEDADKRTQLRVYQVDLHLNSLKDNVQVWAGQEIIRKVVGRSGIKY